MEKKMYRSIKLTELNSYDTIASHISDKLYKKVYREISTNVYIEINNRLHYPILINMKPL
jgi:hypothetical protein